MWRAQTNICYDGVDLLLFERYGDRDAIAQPIEFTLKEIGRGDAITAPTLRLPGESGQQLLQALWDAGLRPNDGSGSGAEAKALREHIGFAERMAEGLLRLQSGKSE